MVARYIRQTTRGLLENIEEVRKDMLNDVVTRKQNGHGQGLYERSNGLSHYGNKLRGGGLKGFEFTDEERRRVKMLAAHGMRLEDICKFVEKYPIKSDHGDPEILQPISVQTLTKYFSYEIEMGRNEANLAVSQVVLASALGRPAEYDDDGKVVRKELLPYFPAAQWWEKSRAGMKEAVVNEHDIAKGSKVTLIIEG